jgi:hypothetical protein
MGEVSSISPWGENATWTILRPKIGISVAIFPKATPRSGRTPQPKAHHSPNLPYGKVGTYTISHYVTLRNEHPLQSRQDVFYKVLKRGSARYLPTLRGNLVHPDAKYAYTGPQRTLRTMEKDLEDLAASTRSCEYKMERT